MWKGNPHIEFIFAVFTAAVVFTALVLLTVDSWILIRQFMKSRKNKGQ